MEYEIGIPNSQNTHKDIQATIVLCQIKSRREDYR